MNKTKNISFKFTMRDLKWLTIYEYFYKNSAVEFFFYSRNELHRFSNLQAFFFYVN